MIKSKEYFTDAEILIAPNKATRIGCIVSNTGVTADSEGKYVVKAGTPLYGTEVGMYRDTALTVASVTTGTSPNQVTTTAQGVLYKDIVFEDGASTANGTLVIVGTVDYLKLDTSVQNLITASAKSALVGIKFVKGRAD